MLAQHTPAHMARIDLLSPRAFRKTRGSPAQTSPNDGYNPVKLLRMLNRSPIPGRSWCRNTTYFGRPSLRPSIHQLKLSLLLEHTLILRQRAPSPAVSVSLAGTARVIPQDLAVISHRYVCATAGELYLSRGSIIRDRITGSCNRTGRLLTNERLHVERS